MLYLISKISTRTLYLSEEDQLHFCQLSVHPPRRRPELRGPKRNAQALTNTYTYSYQVRFTVVYIQFLFTHVHTHSKSSVHCKQTSSACVVCTVPGLATCTTGAYPLGVGRGEVVWGAGLHVVSDLDRRVPPLRKKEAGARCNPGAPDN